MIELLLAATSMGASAAAYGVGRVHGRQAQYREANEWANKKIKDHGAEDALMKRIRETEDKMALAKIHGHPDAFCTERCYQR